LNLGQSRDYREMSDTQQLSRIYYDTKDKSLASKNLTLYCEFTSASEWKWILKTPEQEIIGSDINNQKVICDYLENIFPSGHFLFVNLVLGWQELQPCSYSENFNIDFIINGCKERINELDIVDDDELFEGRYLSPIAIENCLSYIRNNWKDNILLLSAGIFRGYNGNIESKGSILMFLRDNIRITFYHDGSIKTLL
jgi:hypothetical protein